MLQLRGTKTNKSPLWYYWLINNYDSRVMQCSGCKTLFYCGTKCQAECWEDLNVPGGRRPGHKRQCDSLKNQMKRLPDFQAVLEQFPWGWIDMGGQFNCLLFLAMRDLLGIDRSRFGWWITMCDGSDVPTRYKIGKTLLEGRHLDDINGWRLPMDQIPWYDFDHPEAKKPRTFPPQFDENWASYYRWRNLSLESPAAMLLQWPLTVFMLLRRMGLAPPAMKATATTPRKLAIHFIGIEREMDHLPVFNELALLFPYTDIMMMVFGPAVDDLLTTGPDPGRIRVLPFLHSYKAPEALGGGSIKIHAAKTGPWWEPGVLQTYPKPDALIGLNAGASSYPEWRAVFAASRIWDIPFGVSDYSEQSMIDDAEQFPNIIRYYSMGAPGSSVFGSAGIAKLSQPVAMPDHFMNPFQEPGEKLWSSSRLPMAGNGFGRVITLPKPR